MDLQKPTYRKGGETTVSTVSTDSGTATALTNQNLAEHAVADGHSSADDTSIGMAATVSTDRQPVNGSL
jgi:hypothetical protein